MYCFSKGKSARQVARRLARSLKVFWRVDDLGMRLGRFSEASIAMTRRPSTVPIVISQRRTSAAFLDMLKDILAGGLV